LMCQHSRVAVPCTHVLIPCQCRDHQETNHHHNTMQVSTCQYQCC
jgi:hypothetical protein